MLGVLLASSAVLHWGEKLHQRGAAGSARIAVFFTLLLGVVFIALQGMEYRDRLREITPRTNAYGSVFYALTGLHGLHVVTGMAMLAYLLALPRIGESDRPPHRSLKNVARYWHFVDSVWIVIVAVLYVAPRLRS
jgi:cytochrome c oxidase subunit 3